VKWYHIHTQIVTEEEMNIRFTAALVLLLVLVSCRPETPVPTSRPTEIVPVNLVPSPTLIPATATATATPTEVPPTITPTPTVTPTPEPIGYGPSDFPPEVNPLTGLVVSDPSILERRPISFKVNIFPRYNRPPWGISLADIVYDYYHNDGYSRYHTIFYGQDADLVGPIRSGRLLDDTLVRTYQSIFAYGSADPKINGRFLNASYADRLIVERQRALCPPSPEAPLCRFDPSATDLLLGSTKNISEYATERGIDNTRQNLDGMSFHPLTPSGGFPGNDIYTRFSKDDYSHWEYDQDSGRYLLFQDNLFVEQQEDEVFVPLADRLTNAQISAANVIILFANHEYLQRPPADIVEITLLGSGKAFAFRDGQIFEVNWKRQTADSVLFLTYPNGEDFSFKPGNTWFLVMGNSSIVKDLDEGMWRFEFKLP
jgi:hypothetical protein